MGKTEFYIALGYYTTAAWMRGFASGLNEDHDQALKKEMLRAADLLERVWREYETVRNSDD